MLDAVILEAFARSHGSDYYAIIFLHQRRSQEHEICRRFSALEGCQWYTMEITACNRSGAYELMDGIWELFFNGERINMSDLCFDVEEFVGAMRVETDTLRNCTAL